MKGVHSIIVTIPKSIKWKDYERELDAVKNWKCVMNFKVPFLPHDIKDIDRCYLAYDGRVVGWMKVVGASSAPFRCTTTGEEWSGNFIQRSGPFHPVDKDIPYRGFRGFRYFDEREYGLEDS